MKGLGDVQSTLSVLGILVTVSALCAIAIRFSAAHNATEQVLDSNTLAA